MQAKLRGPQSETKFKEGLWSIDKTHKIWIAILGGRAHDWAIVTTNK